MNFENSRGFLLKKKTKIYCAINRGRYRGAPKRAHTKKLEGKGARTLTHLHWGGGGSSGPPTRGPPPPRTSPTSHRRGATRRFWGPTPGDDGLVRRRGNRRGGTAKGDAGRGRGGGRRGGGIEGRGNHRGGPGEGEDDARATNSRRTSRGGFGGAWKEERKLGGENPGHGFMAGGG